MEQQTAVEWLINEIDMQFPSINIKWKEWMIEQAKQMEQEQIVDAHYQGYRNDIGTTEVSEQYYNETYGGQGSPDTTNTQNK